MLRLMGLVAPPASAGIVARVRGILILLALVMVLLALGFGIVKLVALPLGGIGSGPAIFFGFLLVVAALGVLVLLGRRRQRARAPGAG
ncbi:MAG: hypothetical protein H0U84_01155 [Thermoleophilaceae bacterium]|nr:hypothetical protein [Thermoleophilaceae bacterium]